MTELERRKEAAIAAIQSAYGTAEDEFGATLFVSHHLEELEAAYWTQHLQTATPDPSRVLDLLVFKSHWSEEDENGIDALDFTLPDQVTDYVISVRFDDHGGVEEVSMES